MLRHLLLIALALLAGCASNPSRSEAEREEDEEMEMGPPPPGYWRILGDAVPGWTPQAAKGGPDGPVTWSLLGPRPITNEYWSGTSNAGGRVVSIAPHPTDPNTVYIASASGGIWKTTNGGTSWTPLTDELSNLNHGAVALDSSDPNIVYAGTGEYTTNSGGDGLFRSTDAGATWARIATAAQVGSNISKVVIDPTNPQVIHITGSGGYARSANGGTSWTTLLTGSCSDFALNPSNPQIVYIAKHNDGVYRSTTGGTSPVRLANGLPSSGVTRIILALAPSSPTTVYCTIVNSSSGLLGQYKTVNGGDSWTQLVNTPNFPSPQGWYDCCFVVDPTNPAIAYAGGVFPSYAVAGVIKTTDGGASWTDITIRPGGGQLHPDQHALAIGPTGILWVGNDGGVWKSTNAGGAWINCNATLAVSQHYAIALHPTDPSRVVGGTQDNGTVARDLGTQSWPQIVAGDGGFCAYDRTTPSRRYTTYVNLTVYRLNNSSSTNITGPWSGDPRNFISPLVMDPNNTRVLLGGTNRVWRNTAADTSSTWTAISPVVGGTGELTAIAIAQGFSNTVYTGSDTGAVYVTTDAAAWNPRSTGLPSGTISDIFISPTAPGTAYLAIANASGGRVFRTDNYGQTWVDFTGSLPPGVRAKALEVDWRSSPPDLYVGTGVGVYCSRDSGATWTKDGADLPNVNIGDLAIDRTNNTITAGTYGRSVWRADLPAPSTCYANCDGSVVPPLLNVNDFICFQQRFAAGDPYANCDGSTIPPVLNINDFICFQQTFAAGCP